MSALIIVGAIIALVFLVFLLLLLRAPNKAYNDHYGSGDDNQ